MSTYEIVFLALVLSIDAFAVSLAAAATGRLNGGRASFRLAFHLGLFQFIMPVLGWTAGETLEPVIATFDHWVAFGLLCVIAFRMVRSSIAGTPPEQAGDPSRGLTMLGLAIATSVDAMAVGFSMAILHINIWWPSVLIGAITAGVSLMAILLGSRLEARLGRWAEAVGGLILVFIALRILFDHIG
jgi:manganese efflux pump family protein